MRTSRCLALSVAAWTLACAAPVPPEEDRVLVLRELGLPEDWPCPQLVSKPVAPGTFGREGLRIEATCTPPQGWAPAGWSTTWPAAVDGFSRPARLSLPEGGQVRCIVGTWTTGQGYQDHPCDPPPAKVDHYRIAVWDPALDEVRIVFQNSY